MGGVTVERVRDYKELTVWQKSMRLSGEVYRMLPRMPPEERFALSDQMRRSATSIPINIAEGYGRGSRKEYCQFVKIARGSAAELETQLLLVRELELLERSALEAALGLVAEVRRMLHALVCSLEK